MTSSFSIAALRSRHPSSSAQALIGAVVGGKYRLVRTLGQGGMGTVYKAVNVAIGKKVAIKLLHGSLHDDDIAMRRFEREARSMVAIAHPNIVEVLDMGHDGSPFLVMEYVRGVSLKGLLGSQAPLSVERTARIAGQILAALGAAHGRGIVHRDLKPENILITARGSERDFVKVVDFGISTFADSLAQHEREADLTPTGLTMATPFYASPEQLRGANGRDPRVDIYAVGVLLYEMLSGQRPFAGDNLPQLCSRILAGEFAPLQAFRKDVPPKLDAVMRRALANGTGSRYQSAFEFALALVPFGASPPRIDEPEPTETFFEVSMGLETDAAPAPPIENRQTAPATDRAADPRALTAREAANRSPSSARPLRPSVVHEKLARGLFAHFAERYGNLEVRRLVDGLEPSLRRALAAKACHSVALGHALAELDRRFGCGDRAQIAEAGRHFVRVSLREGELAKSAMPELFLSSSDQLWQRYFGCAQARLGRMGRGYGRLELRADDEHARPPVALSIAMIGILDEGLRQSGARQVSVQFVQSRALGDALDAFEASWVS
jgi:serine/threonine protein kinase